MKYRVNRSMTIDIDTMPKIEARMKEEGINFSELMRRAVDGYLNNGAQPASIDSEQIEHKPDTKSFSDMFDDSDYAVK